MVLKVLLTLESVAGNVPP